MEVLKEFGKLIRSRRRERGISQEKLAELCDLSACQIVNIEQGRVNVRFLNLIRLCKECNIETGELAKFYTAPYSEESIEFHEMAHK